MDILILLLSISFFFGELYKPNVLGLQINLLDIAVIVFVVYCVIKTFIAKKWHIYKTPLTKPIALFLSVALLSLVLQYNNVTTQQFFVSISYLLRFALYVSLYFFVAALSAKEKKLLTNGLATAGICILCIGFVQYLFYPNLRNLFYLGWDEHLYRLFSVFLDPNFAGVFFVLFMLFIIRGFTPKGVKPLIGLLCLGAIMLTYSRSALLALVVGVSMYLFLAKKKKLIFGFLAVLVIGILISPKAFTTEGTNLFRTASGGSRIESAENAIAIFTDNPMLGIGFNAYKFEQAKRGYINTKTGIENHAASGADNSFLFVLATTGIIGFGAYMYLWYSILRLYRKNFFVMATIAALFVSALFINSLFYSFFLFWIFVLLGLENSKEG